MTRTATRPATLEEAADDYRKRAIALERGISAGIYSTKEAERLTRELESFRGYPRPAEPAEVKRCAGVLSLPLTEATICCRLLEHHGGQVHRAGSVEWPINARSGS